jgi:isopropylmalate/homocitrate/citramalate synthase
MSTILGFGRTGSVSLTKVWKKVMSTILGFGRTGNVSLAKIWKNR